MKTHKKYSSLRSCRFTLIELIVVIAIIAILAGFSFAAFQGVKGHKSSEAGAQRMADMIALARQYAISENTRVALLLPDTSTSPNLYTGTDFEDDLPAQPTSMVGDEPGIMMQVCEVDSAGSFVGWLDVGGWTLMPENAYFSTDGLTVISNIDYPNPGDSRQSPAIVFQPNGTLTNKLTGTIEVLPFSVSREYYDPGKARQYQISINWLTGQTTTQFKYGGN